MMKMLLSLRFKENVAPQIAIILKTDPKFEVGLSSIYSVGRSVLLTPYLQSHTYLMVNKDMKVAAMNRGILDL